MKLVKNNNKKKIAFVADSIVNLFGLYEYIRENYEIIWIVYHESVLYELKKKGVNSNSIFYVNAYGFLSKKFLPFLVIKKILHLFFNALIRKNLVNKIGKIGKNISPDLWIADTGIFSKLKTKAPKCTFKHSVTYKRHYLGEDIFDFDYVFLPGFYHLNRILNYYSNNIDKKKFLVNGSLKISSYLKKPKLEDFEKKDFLKTNNLSVEKKIITFSTTHDAFGKGRFLPKIIGDQFRAITDISHFVTQELNCNFIIKIHHYQSSLLKNSTFKNLARQKNNMVFNVANYHDVLESENIFRISDIVITDTSGVGPLCIFLKKKVIFLEPDNPFDWNSADIESNLRPGFVCRKLEDIYEALKNNLNSKDKFIDEREKFIEKIFYQHNKDARTEISQSIKKIVN